VVKEVVKEKAPAPVAPKGRAPQLRAKVEPFTLPQPLVHIAAAPLGAIAEKYQGRPHPETRRGVVKYDIKHITLDPVVGQ
jgi:hypothetical protein